MYVENDPAVDRPWIAAHIGACAECAAIMEEFQQIILFLSQYNIRDSFAAADGDRAR
jgi:hypothetical protein